MKELTCCNNFVLAHLVIPTINLDVVDVLIVNNYNGILT